MNTCTTCCNPKTPDCDSVEMSNLQRCNGVTMHGCGNPMYNVYAWDYHHGHCGGPCGPQGCIGYKPEPCAVETLCSYLTKAEAAKIYVNHNEFLAFNTAIADTYATKDELIVDVQGLQEDVQTETEARIAADSALEGRIDAYRDELDNKLNNEISRATSTEVELGERISNETDRATRSEAILQESLNEEIVRAQDAEDLLGRNIEVEKYRAQDVESQLNLAVSTVTSRLNNEITRATNTENSITTNLNNYINTNNAALTNEVNRAIHAETTISNAVSTLNTHVNDEVVHSADYDSANKQILFKNADGTVIDIIDASVFVKDGMVSNVEIVGDVLRITFNTDAGQRVIDIPISSIFDANNYYTKAQVDTKLGDYYTKAEINTLITQAVNSALLNYYTKLQADAKFVTANNTNN